MKKKIKTKNENYQKLSKENLVLKDNCLKLSMGGEIIIFLRTIFVS